MLQTQREEGSVHVADSEGMGGRTEMGGGREHIFCRLSWCRERVCCNLSVYVADSARTNTKEGAGSEGQRKCEEEGSMYVVGSVLLRTSRACVSFYHSCLGHG